MRGPASPSCGSRLIRLGAWALAAALGATTGACSESRSRTGDGGEAGQGNPGDAAEAGSDRPADAVASNDAGTTDVSEDRREDRSPDLAQDLAQDRPQDLAQDLAADLSAEEAGAGADRSADAVDAADANPADAADAGPADGADAGPADAGATCDADAGVGSLLVNGSFEQPLVPAGSYTLFTNGNGISGWTVTGVTGNVAVFSGSFESDGFTFPAEEGQQLLDLTGVSQTATGVSQTVATTSGRTYCLSFWVGNVFNPAGGYGSASSVNVIVNGQLVATPSNQSGQGQTALSWQRFAIAIQATAASTVIAFVNGDPASDNSNFLDNVVLR